MCDVSFIFLPTFSMLALPNSKTRKMMGFVTMEIVILRIPPILWQVLDCLALLLPFIISVFTCIPCLIFCVPLCLVQPLLPLPFTLNLSIICVTVVTRKLSCSEIVLGLTFIHPSLHLSVHSHSAPLTL